MFGPLRTSRQAKLNELFARAAEKLDLTLEPAGRATETPTMSGAVAGIDVSVTTDALWPRASRQLTAWFEPAVPQGSIEGRFPPGEGRVLRVGERGFESVILIRSNKRADWAAYLTRERQSALLSIVNRWPKFEIKGSRITATEMFADGSRVNLVQQVRSLVEFAQVLGGSAVQDPIATPAVSRLAEPDPGEWALSDAGDGWGVLVSGFEAPPSEMERSSDAAIGHLFGSGVSVSAAQERFDALWADQLISWSGTVVSVMPLLDGDELDPGPSTQIVATIGYIHGMHLISNRVQVVVGVSGWPRIRPGQRFSFVGKLSKIDHASRKLYVSEATSSRI